MSRFTASQKELCGKQLWNTLCIQFMDLKVESLMGWCHNSHKTPFTPFTTSAWVLSNRVDGVARREPLKCSRENKPRLRRYTKGFRPAAQHMAKHPEDGSRQQLLLQLTSAKTWSQFTRSSKGRSNEWWCVSSSGYGTTSITTCGVGEMSQLPFESLFKKL